MRGIAVLLILAMSLAGCFTSTAIKPTELPKLNLAPSWAPNPEGGQAQPSRVVRVETPDGRLAEIKGEPDVHVQLKNATEMLFKYPIQSSVENQTLTIMSGSVPKTTIPLGNIEKLELRQDYTAGTVIFVLTGVVLPIALTLLVVATER